MMVASKKMNREFLFHGASGAGKTTTARILARALNCDAWDAEAGTWSGEPCGKCRSCMAGVVPGLVEINASNDRKIDGVREKIRQMHLYPPPGARFWTFLWEESHGIVSVGQEALLKPLEPNLAAGEAARVFNIFLTTEPAKIIPTLRSRLTPYAFEPLSFGEIIGILESVLETEGINGYDANIMQAIASVAEGSVRVALVELDKVYRSGALLDASRAQALLVTADQPPPSILAVSRALIAGTLPGVQSALTKAMKEHDCEAIRISVAGYLRVVMLNPRNKDLGYTFAINSMLHRFIQPYMDRVPKNQLAASVVGAWFDMDLYKRKQN
jgi:DNA polymerase-3 subunit gamma/tau